MNNEINILKRKQREASSKKRLEIKKSTFLKNNFFYKILTECACFKKSKNIASFMSIKSEIPTDCINKFILDSGKNLCLPVINKENKRELIFKIFTSNDKLVEGKYGVKEPFNTKECLPDVIFVPCLAFDEKCFRLGYGGGYYDKTISYFSSIGHNFITVGFAYDEQKVGEVVHDNLDQKLNYILTEKRLYKNL